MLNDYEIRQRVNRGEIEITPDEGIEGRIQPASLDVRLGNEFAVYRRDRAMCIDPKQDTATLLDVKTVADNDVFVVHPGEFVLGTTLERLRLPANLVARVEGKSSLGRLGLMVHSTAGFIDPLFEGEITLELACVNSLPIRLYPWMPIGQLCFSRCSTVTSGGYKGKYQGQRGPTASRYHQNWDVDEERWR